MAQNMIFDLIKISSLVIIYLQRNDYLKYNNIKWKNEWKDTEKNSLTSNNYLYSKYHIFIIVVFIYMIIEGN